MMPTRRFSICFVVTYFLAGYLSGQDANTSALKTEGRSEDNAHEEMKTADLELLQNSFLARFGRGFQYIFARGEQPASVVIGSGNTTQIVANPEHYLNQHSMTFDFKELFVSSSALASMVTAINSSGKGFSLPRGVCGTKSTIECIASAGTWWKRALSGFSVTGALSERPAVQQSTLIPEG